jgi:hypothetical protein
VPSSPFSSAVFRHVAAFLLAFALPLLAIFTWWGGFNEVDIQTGEAGPYTYAYMEKQGDYSKLTDLVSEVEKELQAQKIEAGLPVTVLLDNPELVDVGQRRGRVGFLIPAGSAVSPPLRMEIVPVRPVLIARVHAGSLLAPGMAYAALDTYQQARGQGVIMPTLEIYRAAPVRTQIGEMTVEMPLNAAQN